MEADVIRSITDALRNNKPADLLVEMPEGSRRLMLIPSTLWDSSEPELLIVLESHGSVFFRPGDNLTVFKLITNGFPWHASTKIIELLNAAFPPLPTRLRLRPPTNSP